MARSAKTDSPHRHQVGQDGRQGPGSGGESQGPRDAGRLEACGFAKLFDAAFGPGAGHLSGLRDLGDQFAEGVGDRGDRFA